MEYKVFVHTNEKQWLGALLAKYTIERYSKHTKKFSVEFIIAEKHEELKRLFNQEFLNEGKIKTFSPNDLQTFTLLRFFPPEVMGFKGRAIVIDPDIFCTYADIWDLFSMDMGDNAVMCHKYKGKWQSSCMLLNNEKLTHWKSKDIIDGILKKKIDYRKLMSLELEKQPIGEISENWNSFDTLTPDTKLLHTTLRITQPWRAGLKVDFVPKKMPKLFGFISREFIHTLLGKNPHKHREHPDKIITNYFFGHLKAAVEEGKITEQEVEKEIREKHVRQDAFKVLEKIKAI